MAEFDKLLEAINRGDVEAARALLDSNPELVHQRDALGGEAIHFAAFGGHRDVVRLLRERGANINAIDGKFGATPAGWAIEYLREMNGFLGIELSDFAFAIKRGDAAWVERFLKRFPALREANDPDGKPFRVLAAESGNPDIARLFGLG